MECFSLLFHHSCMNRASVFEWHKRFKEGRESVGDDERCGRSKEVNTPELIGQRVRIRVTMLRFLGGSGRDSFGRGQHSSNRVSGISTRTPIHNTILVTDYFDQDGHQDSCSHLPIVQTLLPVTFGYSLELRGCRYETIEMKEGAVTKVIDTLTQEDFHGAFQKLLEWLEQVHCSRRRLLQRGLEFHVCTINKSAHTKKVWKLI